MRYALTIIFNGLHHLKHNDYAHFIAKTFDKWIIVEGYSGNKGSTSWCNNLNIQKNSTDGTIEYVAELMEQFPNIHMISKKGGWQSKDEQVNKGIEMLNGSEDGWLWQVDIDEQWTMHDIEEAESMMTNDIATAGGFNFHHMLCNDNQGRQLVGKGEWGDNIHTRLWWWKGQKFKTHEPPVMEGQKSVMLLPQKYVHYSYYFEQDVVFKSKYYKGYASLYRNWKRLQSKSFNYPISTKELFGNGSKINHSKSYITTYHHGL
jgi:hypothetical protein